MTFIKNEKLYSYFQNQFNDSRNEIYYQVLKIKKKGIKKGIK
jgi:hypothetical protein